MVQVSKGCPNGLIIISLQEIIKRQIIFTLRQEIWTSTLGMSLCYSIGFLVLSPLSNDFECTGMYAFNG